VDDDKTPEIYYAFAQQPTLIGDMDIEVRARGDAAALIPAMRKIVTGMNPDVPIDRPMTLRAQFDQSYRRPRMFAVMGGFFGLLAALLVAAGLYGLHSFHVRRRNSEIGVRMAFGANRKNVLAMVLKENVLVLAVGLAVGLPLTLLIVRLLKTMLYHLSPFDPLSLLIAMAAISAVSVGAALRPARRAASVVPMEALRTE
jgi:ABC-type antimicrobial peptide transport system permease subunit